MRRRLILAYILVVFAFVMMYFTADITPVASADKLYSFYLQNFISDTVASNAVSSIYLDYRLFDTFFETILLVLSVIGIIYFSTHEGEY